MIWLANFSIKTFFSFLFGQVFPCALSKGLEEVVNEAEVFEDFCLRQFLDLNLIKSTSKVKQNPFSSNRRDSTVKFWKDSQRVVAAELIEAIGMILGLILDIICKYTAPFASS